MVPFIDLKRFEPGLLNAWHDKVASLSAQAAFVGGAEIQQLESSLSDYLGVAHSVSCANGTDALQLALRALGVGKGDLVIIPDMTFWATFEAVVNVGAKVVTVDINMTDGGIDLACLEQAIAQYQPKVAIIAHLFGWATGDLSKVRQLCTSQKVLLLEDGAQCFGAELDNASLYKDALISTTSFYPAKVLGAAGDGGAVFTNNADLAQKVRQLANHGRSSHYGHVLVGWNSRLDSIQAAFLNLALEHLDTRLSSRRQCAETYRSRITNTKLHVMSPPSEYTENGYCNVCLVDDQAFKQRLEAHLKNHNIGFGNIYPSPMSEQLGAVGHLHAQIGNDHTETWCQRVLNLPLFPYMEAQELDQVIQLVNSFEN